MMEVAKNRPNQQLPFDIPKEKRLEKESEKKTAAAASKPYAFALAHSDAVGFTIIVQNPLTKKKWEKNLGGHQADQFNKIVGYCNKTYRGVNPLEASLYPVRTNSLKNLRDDFFLPTVFNHALKVKHIVLRVFATIGAVFLDVPTFAVRLLTCIPRIICNGVRGEAPFHRYLRKEKCPNDIRNHDYVIVTLIQSNHGFERKHIHFRDFPASFLHSDFKESVGFVF